MHQRYLILHTVHVGPGRLESCSLQVNLTCISFHFYRSRFGIIYGCCTSGLFTSQLQMAASYFLLVPPKVIDMNWQTLWLWRQTLNAGALNLEVEIDHEVRPESPWLRFIDRAMPLAASDRCTLKVNIQSLPDWQWLLLDKRWVSRSSTYGTVRVSSCLVTLTSACKIASTCDCEMNDW